MMDLFDDLPEPEQEHKVDMGIAEKSASVWEKNNEDFYSDLPVPSSTFKAEGIKRKAEESNSKLVEKRMVKDLYQLQGYHAERKGEREEMQDRCVILDNFEKLVSHLHPSILRLALYAVFDGHGGSRASNFAASHLHLNLAEKFPKVGATEIDKEIKRTLADAFKKTDEEFLKEATRVKPTWKDGSTAIVVLVIENSLYIANLGDSKAILCRFNRQTNKHIAVPLSKDHSPTDYPERMRIQKSGGHVRDGRVMGILEVSRSIGDRQYKALGVTCIPDVKKCQVTDDDCFVLLACDGIWKVFSTEKVIDIVLSALKDKEGKLESIRHNVCYEAACNKLVNEAIRMHSGDNVTVVIVSIKKN